MRTINAGRSRTESRLLARILIEMAAGARLTRERLLHRDAAATRWGLPSGLSMRERTVNALLQSGAAYLIGPALDQAIISRQGRRLVGHTVKGEYR